MDENRRKWRKNSSSSFFSIFLSPFFCFIVLALLSNTSSFPQYPFSNFACKYPIFPPFLQAMTNFKPVYKAGTSIKISFYSSSLRSSDFLLPALTLG